MEYSRVESYLPIRGGAGNGAVLPYSPENEETNAFRTLSLLPRLPDPVFLRVRAEQTEHRRDETPQDTSCCPAPCRDSDQQHPVLREPGKRRAGTHGVPGNWWRWGKAQHVPEAHGFRPVSAAGGEYACRRSSGPGQWTST